MFKVDLSFLNWNFINSLVICPTIEPLSSWLSLFLWADLSLFSLRTSQYALYVLMTFSMLVRKFCWYFRSYDLEILIICGRSDCSALALDASRLTKSGMPQKWMREMLYATTAFLTIFGAALTIKTRTVITIKKNENT